MASPRGSRPRLEELEGRSLPSAVLVKDINPGVANSDPGGTALDAYRIEEAAVNGVLFFAADDGVHGSELWKTDGTAAGTVLVKDIFPGTSSSYIQQMCNVNGTLFFRASDGVNGTELWKTDGTTAGTVPVVPGPTVGHFYNPDQFTNVNGTLFFTAHSLEGGEVWKSDGTAAGTVLVARPNPTGFSNTRYLTNVNGTLFFRATDGQHGYELWRSNGTAGGTAIVKDIYPGFGSSYPRSLLNVNGVLFFTANDGTDGEELWRSDGSDGGTVMVKDINPGFQNGSEPFPLVNVNGTVFFAARDLGGVSTLWKSDGSPGGTAQVRDVQIQVPDFEAVNNTLFFITGDQLWKSDGTTNGTVPVSPVSPAELTNVGGTLFFRSFDDNNGEELWQSDGTADGTVVAANIAPDNPPFEVNDSHPNLLVNVGGKLFFDANDGVHGEELWEFVPDTTGAYVNSSVFFGSGAGTFDKVELTFSEPVKPDTVTASTVTLTGPGGAVAVASVTPVANTSNTQFDVTFAPQSAAGVYTVNVGPGVLDAAGHQMDQNRNGANGEAGDVFSGTGFIGTIPASLFEVGGADGSIRTVDAATGQVIQKGFRPLDVTAAPYTGIVSVALGDFNQDGTPDIYVTAASPAGGSGLDPSKAGKVYVYDGADLIRGGVVSLLHTYTPFVTTDGPLGNTTAYVNGLNIAVADVNGDGALDLIAGTRGGNNTPTGGRPEYGRLVVIDGNSDAVNTTIGGIQKPFGNGYQKGVVVAAGDVDGDGKAEIAVTRGGPVNSPNPATQRIKVKVLQLRGVNLTELPLNPDGSTAFAPFGGLAGAANGIRRDGRVAFVDQDGNGKAELVYSALDPLTNPGNEQVRVGVFSISTAATAGAATVLSTGPDGGTYTTGTAVVDHAISHVAGTGPAENLALLTESASSGLVYLAPLTGQVLGANHPLSVRHGGITLDGI
jgi:ELWxxDGT repeat protein